MLKYILQVAQRQKGSGLARLPRWFPVQLLTGAGGRAGGAPMAVMAAAGGHLFFYSLYGWLEWQWMAAVAVAVAARCGCGARACERWWNGTCDAELENTTALPLAHFVADVLRASKELAYAINKLISKLLHFAMPMPLSQSYIRYFSVFCDSTNFWTRRD